MTHFASLLFSFLLVCLPPDGWLGVYLDPDSDQPRIIEVVPESPAAKAGLRPGDVVLSFDGKATADRDDLIAKVRACTVGQRVELKVERDGKEVQVVVQLAERPAAVDGQSGAGGAAGGGNRPPAPAAPRGEAAPAPRPPAAGAQRAPAFVGIAIGEGDDGVVIDRVLDGSPAQKAGLREGDQLRRWGKRTIEDVDQIDEIVGSARSGDEVEIQVERDGEAVTVRLTYGTRRADAGTLQPRTTRPDPTEKQVKAEPVELPFGRDLEAATEQAKATKRPLLVVCTGADDASTAQRRVFAEPELKGLLQHFVVVQLESGRDAAAIEARGIGELPAFDVVVDGKLKLRQEGLATADTIRRVLAPLAGGAHASKPAKAQDPAAVTAPAPDKDAKPAKTGKASKAAASAPEQGGGDAGATGGDAALRKELEQLRRDVDELRRLLEELQKARGRE